MVTLGAVASFEATRRFQVRSHVLGTGGDASDMTNDEELVLVLGLC